MSEPDLIPCQRQLFDLPGEVAYLNCAYMSPLLKHAAAAGRAAIDRKLRPWQLTPADFFTESETARSRFADLLGTSVEGIAIVPAASYGIAVAARNLAIGPDQRILVIADQFPSNVYPWRVLAGQTGAEVVAASDAGHPSLSAAVLARLDERVRIVALPHCRWTDGALLDLPAIADRCREVGAALVLDVTQSLGALPLDLDRVRPDFLVAAGYKWLLGPYSVGYLYVAPEHRDGRPLEENWIGRHGSEDFSRLIDYQDGYQPGARRFDVGERANFGLLPASIAGLEQLLAWGVPAIARTLLATTRTIAARASALGLEPTPEARRAPHFLGVRFPRGLPPGLLTRLADRHVHVSVRGDSMRVTPHVYNHEGDVDRLFEALGRVL